MMALPKVAPHGNFLWRSVAQSGCAPQQLAPIGERMWRIGAPLILPYRRSVAQPAASGAPPAEVSSTGGKTMSSQAPHLPAAPVFSEHGGRDRARDSGR